MVSVKQVGGMLIGIVRSVFYICIAGAQFLYGPLSDRYGRETFMILGLISSAVAWSLFPYAGKLSSTLLLGLAAGSLGGFFVSSMAFLNEKAPDNLKGTISGAYYLFWGMGYFLGPIVCGICGTKLGMEKIFVGFGAFLLLTAATIYLIWRKGVSRKYA